MDNRKLFQIQPLDNETINNQLTRTVLHDFVLFEVKY